MKIRLVIVLLRACRVSHALGPRLVLRTWLTSGLGLGATQVGTGLTRAKAKSKSARDSSMKEIRKRNVAHHIYVEKDTEQEFVINDHIFVRVKDPEVLNQIKQEHNLVDAGSKFSLKIAGADFGLTAFIAAFTVLAVSPGFKASGLVIADLEVAGLDATGSMEPGSTFSCLIDFVSADLGLAVSFLAVSCLVVSCLVVSCLVASCLAVSWADSGTTSSCSLLFLATAGFLGSGAVS